MGSFVTRPGLSRSPGARRRGLGAALLTLLVAAYVLLSVLPVWTIVLGSLKSSEQVTTDPLGLPNPVHFDNFARGWRGVAVGEPMSTYFVNTAIYSAACVIVATVAGTMAAYALARRSGFSSAFLNRYFVVLYALPFLAIIVPLFSITGDLGIRSNPLGIGVVTAAGWLALTVMLMFGFFSTFPLDVIEAAKTDGASELRTFWQIVIPMSKGPMFSCALLCFINAWNNLAYTLPLLVRPDSTTIAPGLLLFSGRYSVDLGAQLAGMTISILPLIAAYLLMHRHVMESFRVGAFR